MSTKSVKKVVLAYSGGVDTSVCIPWLKEHYGCDVIAVIADLGQGEDLEFVKKKAIQSGAAKASIEDLRDNFVTEFAFQSLKANTIYEGKYLLATALGRPLIAQRVVEIARKEGADALAHGCTGKGNDQVRFDLAFMALAPDLRIIAPVREWTFQSREEEIAYAQELNIPLEVSREKPYSIDRNLWGAAIECGILEDPWSAPPADIYSMTTLPVHSSDTPEIVEIEFEKGIPTRLNNSRLEPVAFMEEINRIAGRHGIGLSDLIEDRLVGIKSREVYECPGGTVLFLCHKDLENLVLDRDTIQFKETVSQIYARLIYNGQWFSPLRESMNVFVDKTQECVTGTVRAQLYKGNVTILGRKSSFSLYSKTLATYEKEDSFNHREGEAFCRLWGLPLKVASQVYSLNKG